MYGVATRVTEAALRQGKQEMLTKQDCCLFIDSYKQIATIENALFSAIKFENDE